MLPCMYTACASGIQILSFFSLETWSLRRDIESERCAGSLFFLVCCVSEECAGMWCNLLEVLWILPCELGGNRFHPKMLCLHVKVRVCVCSALLCSALHVKFHSIQRASIVLISRRCLVPANLYLCARVCVCGLLCISSLGSLMGTSKVSTSRHRQVFVRAGRRVPCSALVTYCTP